ncbi:MAG: hypothetical protein VYB05_21380 [Pseudomonadota bacterium]|nr:hypothetical protein [Pseudomonadota bacterium]
MTNPSARINAFRAAVVAEVKTAMPALRQCEEQFGRFNLDDLETNVIPSPAVRIAVLKAAMNDQAGGEVEANLSCAAFIITDGRERDAEAWTIAEALVVLLHSAQMWGLTKLGAPEKVEIQPLVTVKLKQRGAAIMAVEWTQRLRNLGEGIFDDEQHLLTELYVNNEQWIPEDGGSHG